MRQLNLLDDYPSITINGSEMNQVLKYFGGAKYSELPTYSATQWQFWHQKNRRKFKTVMGYFNALRPTAAMDIGKKLEKECVQDVASFIIEKRPDLNLRPEDFLLDHGNHLDKWTRCNIGKMWQKKHGTYKRAEFLFAAPDAYCEKANIVIDAKVTANAEINEAFTEELLNRYQAQMQAQMTIYETKQSFLAVYFRTSDDVETAELVRNPDGTLKRELIVIKHDDVLENDIITCGSMAMEFVENDIYLQPDYKNVNDMLLNRLLNMGAKIECGALFVMQNALEEFANTIQIENIFDLKKEVDKVIDAIKSQYSELVEVSDADGNILKVKCEFSKTSYKELGYYNKEIDNAKEQLRNYNAKKEKNKLQDAIDKLVAERKNFIDTQKDISTRNENFESLTNEEKEQLLTDIYLSVAVNRRGGLKKMTVIKPE